MTRRGRRTSGKQIQQYLGVRYLKPRKAWCVAILLADDTQTLRRLDGITTKAQARKRRDELAAALERGDASAANPVSAMTVNELLDEVLEKYWRARGRCDDVARMLERYIRPSLGSASLQGLRVADLQNWYCNLGGLVSERTEKPLSWQTREHVFGKLRSALSRAVEWEYIPRSPAKGVKRDPDPHVKQDYEALSVEELRRLIGSAPPELAPLFATAGMACLRRGEIAALRWHDVDLEDGRLTVRFSYDRPRKGGRPNEIMMPPELVTILGRWKREWCQINHAGRDLVRSDDLVFPVPITLRMRNRGSHYLFGKLIAAATGGRVRRFHALRHTGATLHLEATGDLVYVQELGGWRDQRMLQRYLHTRREYKKARAAKINLGLDGAGEVKPLVKAINSEINSRREEEPMRVTS